MPSGYTADLYEGKKDVTFEKFVLTCARAFMSSMRDEPLGADIPDPKIEVESYIKDNITTAKKDVAKYAKMTVAEAGKQMKKNSDENKAFIKKAKLEARDIFMRYHTMLTKVEHWNPPKDLESLKKFMQDQLSESIKFDCAVINREEKEEKMTAKQYLTLMR